MAEPHRDEPRKNRFIERCADSRVISWALQNCNVERLLSTNAAVDWIIHSKLFFLDTIAARFPLLSRTLPTQTVEALLFYFYHTLHQFLNLLHAYGSLTRGEKKNGDSSNTVDKRGEETLDVNI
eukprot:scaffold13255_cov171-Skeletonema_menzelii.AAC.3